MEANFYKTYFEVEKNHWWFKGRRNLLLRLISAYSRPGKLPRILDVGCGTGYLVGILQNRGYDAHGIDVSTEAIEFGSHKGIHNLSVTHGRGIEALPASFDQVFLLDTLEHIKDDGAMIKEAERVLVPGGIAIITVPAYMWLWGVQDEVAQHYRRYTMSSLLNLISSNSGLRVVEKSYFNTFLFPVVAIVRLLSKLLGIQGRESDFDIHSHLLNNLLFWIFNAEIWLLRFLRYPFGVSILVVLKKHE